MSIKINKTDITLRPSSVESFLGCAYQWGKVFLEGVITIPSSRAAIGTGIHKSVESMWTEAIERGIKDPNTGMMFDAGIEAFQKEAKNDRMSFNDGETKNSCEKEITNGVQAYVDDVLPYLDIPTFVEQRYSMPIKHPIVKRISGTVDYIKENERIDDVKSSKRKIPETGHRIQQSIYKMLAEHNGQKNVRNYIQGVILTKKPYGTIHELVTNVEEAKWAVNGLLDAIECAVDEVAPMEILFRPNPKHYLCSVKYCALFGSCPATKMLKRNA